MQTGECHSPREGSSSLSISPRRFGVEYQRQIRTQVDLIRQGLQVSSNHISDTAEAPNPAHLYQTLNKSRREFRVLILHPGSEDDSICGTLLTRELPVLPPGFEEHVYFRELEDITCAMHAVAAENMTRHEEESARWESISCNLEWLFHLRAHLSIQLILNDLLEPTEVIRRFRSIAISFAQLRKCASSFLSNLMQIQSASSSPLSKEYLQGVRKRLCWPNSEDLVKFLSCFEDPQSSMTTSIPQRDELLDIAANIHFLPGTDFIPFYEAVSYCCGDIETTQDITLNGMSINAPASAVDTLAHLRHSRDFKFLWIDAICINQDDAAERESQILLMSTIYSSAQRTLIYLGEEDENTKVALRYLHALGQQCLDASSRWAFRADSKDGAAIIDTVDAQGTRHSAPALIASVFQRPYFRRLWVYQEALLSSRDCICFVGNQNIGWTELEDAVAYLVNIRGDPSVTFQSLSPESQIGVYMPLYTKAARQRGFYDGMPLFLLASQTLSLRSRDPRDRIYGLIGLTIWERRKQRIPLRILPDYHKTIRDCMRDATIVMIEECGNLDPIFANLSTTSDPTWAIQWHEMVEEIGTQEGNLPLAFDDGSKTKYEACGTQTLDLYNLTNSNYPDSLFLTGHHTATVKAISAVFESRNKTKLEWLQQWVQILDCAIKLTTNSSIRVSPKILVSTLTASCLAGGSRSMGDEANHDLEHVFMWLMEKMRPGTFENILPDPPCLGCNQVQTIRDRIDRVYTNRRLFVTTTGTIGIGPREMQIEDEVVILFGPRMPIVLRTHLTWKTLVGPAYIDSLMDGTTVSNRGGDNILPSIFEVR
jgi:hypothetical protein